MVSDDDSGPNETPMNWILSAFELTSTTSSSDGIHVSAPPSLQRTETSTGRSQRWVEQPHHTASH